MTTPAVILTRRRLADVARPARGRRPAIQVLFSIVPTEELESAARQLTDLVVLSAGPTRLGPAVVDVAFREDDVAWLLSSPITLRVPVRRLHAVSQMFAAAPKRSVLLAGHCPVLWTQTSGRLGAS